MSVKRYEFELYHCNGGEMLVSDTGDYVSYDDYAALEARCASLAAEKEKFAVECAATKIVIAYLKSGRQDFSLNTPSTDAFLAEVRASALEYYANLFKDTVNMDVKHNQEFHKGTLYVADQFRKGAAQ
ncbi:hypothetical protein RCP77_07955 [Enterobacter kobei]|uniref:hypothetical protein n=1 Tax=Enterobacter kobei TaxID=208224 RepID=UPI002A76116C|nr:hypothetical protein [Enterobacter kobei]MDY3578612.1 hypothetical protein [Enterobacter kobei]